MILYLVYNHCLVTEGIHYREANGRIKPDIIPTTIFPMDPGKIPATRDSS